MPIAQFKNPGDNVTNAEYNALVTFANSLETSINNLTAQLTAAQVLGNRLQATLGAGLNVNVAGGVLRRASDGVTLTIAPFTAPIPASSTNRWLFVKPDGTWAQSTKKPREGFIIAQVTTSATVVTSIVDRRSSSFEITQQPERKILHVVKSGVQNLAVNTVEQIKGFVLESATDGVNGYGITADAIMNLTTGDMVLTQTAEYSLFARCQVLGGSGLGSGKLSMYAGSTEIRILEEKEVAQNRVTLSGYFEGTLNAGTNISTRVQVSGGSALNIPSNTNTEVLLKVYG